MSKYSKGEWTNARYDICEIEKDGDVYCTVATKDVDLIIKMLEENEQLKQRNDNQYNQLKQLWELIEKGDWETLTAMDKKMKEDEERLQREWKCYE